MAYSYLYLKIRRSREDSALKFQNFTFHFPILFRQETSFFDVFFEVGGYHDLSTGMTSTYEFTSQTFINDMYQELPEPLIKDDTKTITGSNYGLILGLGNKELLTAQNLELRCQYYHSLSKSVPLGEYRYISQSGLDLSVNYRF